MKVRLSLLSCFVVLCTVFAQLSWSENTRLSILRPTSTVTHQWVYMPSGEAVTQQGLKNKQYPLTMLPEVSYMQSELINIEGCDLGFSVRYYVSTTNTHPIKVELVNETGNVIYSYVNNNPQLNESTMTMGDVAQIGILEDVKQAKIRLTLSKAYNKTEAINIDELELYSKNGAGVESVARKSVNIATCPQGIIINSEKDSTVEIYSLSGTLIKTNAIHAGVNRINISSGFYLLNIGGKAYKVIVP